jgi:plastocyanin
MRKLNLVIALISIAVLAPAAFAATTRVKVKDDFFKPKRVEISKGDKVRWVWRGDNVHNVALKKPGQRQVARRSDFKTSGKFTHTFRKVGTWKYLCETHPDDMRGRVIVSR